MKNKIENIRNDLDALENELNDLREGVDEFIKFFRFILSHPEIDTFSKYYEARKNNSEMIRFYKLMEENATFRKLAILCYEK